jgi:hypothetical protein
MTRDTRNLGKDLSHNQRLDECRFGESLTCSQKAQNGAAYRESLMGLDKALE